MKPLPRRHMAVAFCSRPDSRPVLAVFGVFTVEWHAEYRLKIRGTWLSTARRNSNLKSLLDYFQLESESQRLPYSWLRHAILLKQQRLLQH